MLEVRGLRAWYGHIQALFAIDLEVGEGETLALVGTNGAGKSTTVGAIAGYVRATGSIHFRGLPVEGVRQYQRARLGMRLVPENRGLFWRMTVDENLELGRGGSGSRTDVEEVLEAFPLLGERRKNIASDLSGGEQQMLAIARALVGRPSFLMLDEPSLGLAPRMIDQVYERLANLKRSGLTMLLVEQSIQRARTLADRLCLIRTGEVVATVAASDESGVGRLTTEALGYARAESALE